MSAWIRLLATGLVMLSFDQTARAGPAMYSASFIMHVFGNDITTGSISPYNTSTFWALPLGNPCHDPFPYTPSASPNTRYCSPAVFRAGQPATGPRAGGPSMISTTGAGNVGAGITMPQSAFGVTAAGSFPTYPYYLQSLTNATFVNDAGGFFAGGGPAAGGTVSKVGKGATLGSWVIRPGERAFGGAMGLLGKLGGKVKRTEPGVSGTYVASGSRNMVVALGRSLYATSTGTTPQGSGINWLNPHFALLVYSNTYAGLYPTVSLRGSGTRWTTGRVSIYGLAGGFPTILHRTGYDTSMAGVRNIQLVTPAITHMIIPFTYGDEHRAFIGVLNLQIVPEPGAIVLLAAGIAILALLYQLRHRVR